MTVAAIFGVAALLFSLFLMLIGACVDRHFMLNATRRAYSYSAVGFVLGAFIFTLGYLARGQL